MTLFEKFITEGNEKEDELAKEGAMKDAIKWQRSEPEQSGREERRRFTQPCSTLPAFTVWWRNGTTVKNLSPSQKRSGPFVNKKGGGNEASCGVVCDCKQISLYEIREKQEQEAQKAKKPKAKALWAMKAAKDNGEEYYDPSRKDNICGMNKT